MIQLTVITVGNLKESYWREAVAEYEKRLGSFCKPTLIELKETRVSENPSEAEIRSVLAEEGKRILAAIPPRAFRIALCVEGKQFSSEELAQKLNSAVQQNGAICCIIGSSHGLSDEVKDARAKLEYYGISVSAIGSPFGKINLDGDMDRHMDTLRRLLTTANEVGAKYMRMFSFYAPKGKKITDFRGEVLDALERAVVIAREYGVTLCHENEAKIYGETMANVYVL